MLYTCYVVVQRCGNVVTTLWNNFGNLQIS